MGYINASAHHSFFTRRFCGTKGVSNALVTTFLSKLIAAADAEGIPTQYEPDNESRLATILARLNFDAPRPKSVSRKRPAASLTIPPSQPTGQRYEPGSASGVRLSD